MTVSQALPVATARSVFPQCLTIIYDGYINIFIDSIIHRVSHNSSDRVRRSSFRVQGKHEWDGCQCEIWFENRRRAFNGIRGLTYLWSSLKTCLHVYAACILQDATVKLCHRQFINVRRCYMSKAKCKNLSIETLAVMYFAEDEMTSTLVVRLVTEPNCLPRHQAVLFFLPLKWFI